MYTLKSIARRGTLLGAAFALLAATLVPALPVYADSLNPLTDRSLTLSSGSPGWAFTDGSGNGTYAPPNSGANGQKTGNTFDFKVSSSATVEGFSFQYCTRSAGDCTAPGDNAYATGTGTIDLTSASTAVSGSGTNFVGELTVGSAIQTAGGNKYIVASIADNTNLTLASAATATETGVAFVTRSADSATTSDLNIVTSNPSQATFGTYVTDTDSSTNEDGMVSGIPAPTSSGNNFLVYYLNGTTWTASPVTWTMAATNKESSTLGDMSSGDETGKNNYITLTNSTGQAFTAGQRIKVVFFATDSNYITNPGSEEFFVKINTWNTDTPATWVPGNSENIDGGVTVANVMNESIQITTKVLETMDFSVGTVDPYTLEATGGAGSELQLANGNTTHGTCEPVLKGMLPADPSNVLNMGDESAEFSLRTTVAYSTHSYWRLSSNSSAGATVYYSGSTLSNTVGDQIDAIYGTVPGDGLPQQPIEGMEQFGLAIANDMTGFVDTTPMDLFDDDGLAYPVNYSVERTGGDVFEWGADNATSGIHASVTDDGISNLDANPSWHSPQLYPLVAAQNYDAGVGSNNIEYGAVNTQYAFDPASMTIPVPIASQDLQVVDCVTAKMRYIANIASTTPAGIYTTKINYIAAPQY